MTIFAHTIIDILGDRCLMFVGVWWGDRLSHKIS